jgi:hypothetical protein
VSERSGFENGFWRAPRWLRDELDDGNLTLTQFALIHYLAESGADREGAATRYGDLSARFQVSQRTIERAMSQLRDRGLLAFEIKTGQRTPFRVTLGARLVELPPTAPPTLQGGSVSEVTTDTTGDTTSDTTTTGNGRDPASTNGSSPDSTSDTTGDTTSDSRVRAETETEKERKASLYERRDAARPSAPLRCCAPVKTSADPDGPDGPCISLKFANERQLREHLRNRHWLDDQQIDAALRPGLTVIEGAAA